MQRKDTPPRVLDIKPQNILLDEEFVPKVADFGLSWPMDRDKLVVVTTMRGTPGYLAPEWLKEAGSIDVKCDVFSFGMLLLEVVSGRKNSDQCKASRTDLLSRMGLSPKLTDAKLESKKDRAQLMNMITTAFLCIVDKPEWQPSMAQVVKMLEAGEYEELLEASRVLRQREPQLVFVLMSKPDRSLSVDHASKHYCQLIKLLCGGLIFVCLQPWNWEIIGDHKQKGGAPEGCLASSTHVICTKP